MHCPYCNSFNADNASFCGSCGRSFVARSQSASRPGQAPQPQPALRPVVPAQAPVRPQAPVQGPGQAWPQKPFVAPMMPPPLAAPEPPAPFPPHTIAQLQALESGALPYTLVSEIIGNGRRKTVRIFYAPAVAWQQVATLLKALKEYGTDKFDTVIVQGVFAQAQDVYDFTNGQICFDRNVRLGDRMMNRYQIETGNGFGSDTLRIVLSEE